MRTSVGRCPRKWSNGCVERWRASRRTDISFIGTISHSLGCKKQRAPLDLQTDYELAAIRMVKFLQPLKHEQQFTICFSANNDDTSEVNFCCRIEGRVIAEGQLEVYCRTKGTSRTSHSPTDKHLRYNQAI